MLKLLKPEGRKTKLEGHTTPMDWYSASAVKVAPALSADLKSVEKDDQLIRFRAEILCQKENLRTDRSMYNAKMTREVGG
jgi:hypothetical protein